MYDDEPLQTKVQRSMEQNGPFWISKGGERSHPMREKYGEMHQQMSE